MIQVSNQLQRAQAKDGQAIADSPHLRISHGLRKGADETGTALVEFALVLPLFALMLVGVLHFGKALNYWLDGEHLANEAARYASVNKNPGASESPPLTLQQWIQGQADTSELREGGPDATALRVCVSFPGPAPVAVGDPVKVSVHTSYSWIPMLKSVLDNKDSTQVSASSTMRLEQAPDPTVYDPANNPTGCPTS